MSDETDAPPPSGEAGSREGSTSTTAAAPEGRRRRRRRRRGGQEGGAEAHAADGGDADASDEGDDGGAAPASGTTSGTTGGAASGAAAPPPRDARPARREERPQSGRPPREGRGPQGGAPRQRGEGRGDGPRNDGRGDGPRGELRGEPRGTPQRPDRGQSGPESGRSELGGGRNGDRVRRDRGRGAPPSGQGGREGQARDGQGGAASAAGAGGPAPQREPRQGGRDGQSARDGQGGRDQRQGRDRGRGRGGEGRPPRREEGRAARPEDDDDLSPAEAAQLGTSSLAAEPRESLPRLGDRVAPAPAAWDEDDEPSPSAEAKVDWGKDDDGAAAAVTLPPSLPAEFEGEHDPATQMLDLATDTRGPRGDVVSVVGVRFAAAGRVSLYDSGGAHYAAGAQVLVDGERGPRVGTVAVGTERRTTSDRGLRRVMRLATANDVERELPSAERARQALRLAKDRTAALNLPVKVFRAEFLGNGGRNDKLLLYITTEERIDLRDLLRDLGNATGARVELRQLGARDEAKAVGGIGSCGLTLCCTTWLPEFVPVSIKMAKDQGLVLNPQKVAGQCGRLKCCLVYEQAGYAELRKGLPKLGKRVVTARGEGRVVEVDVLRQRVRVSYGPGESEVMPAGEVRPMFPSGNTPASGRRDGGGRGSADEGADDHDERDDDGDAEAQDLATASAAAPPEPPAFPDGADDPEGAAAPGSHDPE